MMIHQNFSSPEDDLNDLEAFIEQEYPGSIDLMKGGNRLLVIQASVMARSLLDHELRVLGAIVKVASARGNTVVVGNWTGVTALKHVRWDPNDFGGNLGKNPPKEV